MGPLEPYGCAQGAWSEALEEPRQAPIAVTGLLGSSIRGNGAQMLLDLRYLGNGGGRGGSRGDHYQVFGNNMKGNYARSADMAWPDLGSWHLADVFYVVKIYT